MATVMKRSVESGSEESYY